jgi:hypothetical protein
MPENPIAVVVTCVCGNVQLLRRDRLGLCSVCNRVLKEMIVKPNKKPDAETLKQELAVAALKVLAAKQAASDAERLQIPMIDERTMKDWTQARKDTQALDKDIDLDEAEVHVLKIMPEGGYKDVSDRVSLKDIMYDQIEDVDVDPGFDVPRNDDGRVDREVAMRLLDLFKRSFPLDPYRQRAQMEPVYRGGQNPFGISDREWSSAKFLAKTAVEAPRPSVLQSIKEMEIALAESDKILKHFKE